jgi:hypothetical protein
MRVPEWTRDFEFLYEVFEFVSFQISELLDSITVAYDGSFLFTSAFSTAWVIM